MVRELKPDFDAILKKDREWQKSANSSLAVLRQPNDWTDLTLPDAEPDDQSRPGPFRPFAIGLKWIEGLSAALL